MATSKNKRVGIRELKNQASRIVDEVREGAEPYVVTKRGRPVAVIRPWTLDDMQSNRAARAQELLAGLDELAHRVARAAGRRSARKAVSDQRR